MKKQKTNQKNLLFKLIIGLFLIFYSNSILAQTNTGISIAWDVEVACQVSTNGDDPRGGKDPVFLENIQDTECIKVCEDSHVNYFLFGDLGDNPNTQWSIVGGLIDNQSNSSCSITWGTAGQASLSFTINTPGGIVTKSICFEKIIKPIVNFTITPYANMIDTDDLISCRNQVIHFSNQSITNNGSNLNTYFWDFGDGTFSSTFEPNHVYTENGEYNIKLTVTNSCGCSTTIEHEILINGNGFNISCPGVVCEGQTVTYSLPFSGQLICRNRYNWSVIGGEVTNMNHETGDIIVNWNHVDENGFGYVSFFPSNCRLPCLMPSSIKIPVIQSKGTITGNTNLCQGSQGRYKLPQWPTTDFHWEIVGNVNDNLAHVILTDQRNEVIIEPLTSGTITLRATYQNTLLNCGGTASFTIHVSKPINIEGETILCQYTTGNYGSSTEVDWTLKDSSGATIDTLSATNQYSYTFNAAGNYTISANGSNACGIIEKNITVIAQPQSPEVTGDLIVCPDAPYTYTVTNPDPNAQYLWTVSSGTFIGSNIGNQATIKFNNVTPNHVYVYNQTTAPIVCSSEPTLLNIQMQQINASISSADSAVCDNNYYQYHAVITGSSPEADYTEGEVYTWSISPANLGSISSGQGTKDISILWNNVTTITQASISLVIQKCTITSPPIIKLVDVRPLLQIAMTTPNTTICSSPNSIHFQLSATNAVPLDANAIVTWTIGGATIPETGISINHVFDHYIGGDDIHLDVSAIIASPNGCPGNTNRAIIHMTIMPQPPASLSPMTGNKIFCTTADIVKEITAATLTNASIQWYNIYNGVTTAITGATSGILNCHQFGDFYFIATSPQGCTNQSNIVGTIIQGCDGGISTDNPTVPGFYCGINVTATNDASVGCTTLTPGSNCSNCGNINLIGTASPTPISQSWTIIGPNINVSNYTNPTIPAQVGVFDTFYQPVFLCDDETTQVQFSMYKKIIVPYIADFGYVPVCNGDNLTFTIAFSDNSNFFWPVASRNFEYSYRLVGSTTWTTAVTTQNGTLPNLPAGSYQFRLVIYGSLDNVPQQPCEKIINVNLVTNTGRSLVINTPSICHDTAVQFNVDFNLNGDSFLWTFDTNAQNTLQNPIRVFPASGQQHITVDVTNKYGCVAHLGTNVTIPPKCYNGDVVSNPTPPVKCAGYPITISYLPSSNECAVNRYTWMEGTHIKELETTNATYTATTSGFYWVKVKSIDGCTYNTPSRITPYFITPPSVHLEAPANICEGNSITMKAITNATTLDWYINNTIQTLYHNQTMPTFDPLPFGTYQIAVTVTSPEGCTATAMQLVSVIAIPDVVIDPPTILCEENYHVILTAASQSGGIFNWSNGMSGESITVTDGGAYQVRVTNGGCSATAQVTVAKNPEDYIWIFPSGCIAMCKKEIEGSIIGPRLPLMYWEWTVNESIPSHGEESFPLPLPVVESGTYSLDINTGTCGINSNELNYTSIECEECKIGGVVIKESTLNDTKFCSFHISLDITNDLSIPMPITITDPDNRVIIIPSNVTLTPGTATYSFTFIPIGTFAGNEIVHLQITGITKDGKPCTTQLNLAIPSCFAQVANKTKESNTSTPAPSVVIAPNPAKDQVTINYKGLAEDTVITLYDLSSRTLETHVATGADGSMTLPTSSYPAGIYIVVVKSNGNLITQQKLIIE